ncbi:hypothetical protein CHLRE_04g216650v5 [Chlamydomonas reinhardtii]|uniref:DUF98 domain-containing protein n=1 Tax=Chlamydomonas reinhardtii TaxID=3055 RepID=A0A2K3DTA1_CHLRE|nr:uncharacterized protein CHLRE_04g216650v5 [Chlamydomonas reinhardtii]PNW83761.1 hypothetical protein CHLRE_04g216650v5 [Chlamydomonas reinhardtii]
MMGPSANLYHPRAPPACTSGRVANPALPRYSRAVHPRQRPLCRAAPGEQSPWGAAPAVSVITTTSLAAGDGEPAVPPASATTATTPAATAATNASAPEPSGAAAGPAAVAGGGGAVPWLALQPPFTYMAGADAALSDAEPSGLSPMWKLLLLSDGSVTRHLQLLSGAPVTVECLSMAAVGEGLAGCPPGTHLIPGPRVQRQVVLRCKPTTATATSATATPSPPPPPDADARTGARPPGPGGDPAAGDPAAGAAAAAAAAADADGAGVPLVYACSWWAADTVDAYLTDRSKPIWISLSQGHVELYREVHALFRGQAPPELEDILGCKGPFWGRHYVFWSAGKPLTLIYEVFSPRLGAWLGPQEPAAAAAAAGSSSGGGWAAGALEEGAGR